MTRKTDVLDCMWIQKLHSLGLLSGSFLLSDVIGKTTAEIVEGLRGWWRDELLFELDELLRFFLHPIIADPR